MVLRGRGACWRCCSSNSTLQASRGLPALRCGSHSTRPRSTGLPALHCSSKLPLHYCAPSSSSKRLSPCPCDREEPLLGCELLEPLAVAPGHSGVHELLRSPLAFATMDGTCCGAGCRSLSRRIALGLSRLQSTRSCRAPLLLTGHPVAAQGPPNLPWRLHRRPLSSAPFRIPTFCPSFQLPCL